MKSIKRIIREEVHPRAFGKKVGTIMVSKSFVNLYKPPNLVSIDDMEVWGVNAFNQYRTTSIEVLPDVLDKWRESYNKKCMKCPWPGIWSDLGFNPNQAEVVIYYEGYIPWEEGNLENVFESTDFDWISSNKWENLVNSFDMLANDRKLDTNEDPEVRWKYWNRKDFKVWLGELSDEEFQKLREEIAKKGYRLLTDRHVIDSLYITVDRDYSKKGDRVIFSHMGCVKEPDDTWNGWTRNPDEKRLCKKVGDEYRITPERLEYDRNFYDSHGAQEISL